MKGEERNGGMHGEIPLTHVRHRIGKSGWPVEKFHVYYIPTFRTEHMFEVDNEILFNFSCEFHDIIDNVVSGSTRMNQSKVAVKTDDWSYEFKHSEASDALKNMTVQLD